jgi:hypothetical protein
MDDDALLTEVLALLPHKTGEQCGGGIAEVPGEGTSRRASLYNAKCICHNPLIMKRFHGEAAGNPHACSLKSSIGKVSFLVHMYSSIAVLWAVSMERVDRGEK